jgi:DNA-binding XRE family transcriptional regulator
MLATCDGGVVEAGDSIVAYKVRWTVEQRNKFVRRWLKFRADHGLTQETLAEAMGVHVNTVNRVEKGKFVPSNETVLRFAEVEDRYREGKKTEKVLNVVPGSSEEL